jgi:hypothetical protein
MIEKFTKHLADKLYVELQKKDNQKRLNEIIKVILANILYYIAPYLGIGIILYLILILLNIYIIFQIKNISINNI